MADDIGASNQRQSDFLRNCPDNYGGPAWDREDEICANCGRPFDAHPILSEEGDCYDPR